MRLESFSGIKVRRSCPFAPKRIISKRWNEDLVYEGSSGKFGMWKGTERVDDTWTVCFNQLPFNQLVFSLSPSAMGQVGIFPEQQENWLWIKNRLLKYRQKNDGSLKVLNAFAYTGGSSLAALSIPGVHVVHLDASKTCVQVAKQNAKLSGLEDRPVRWIVDDCMTYIQREIARKNTYDAVILDPPAFGRSGKNKAWKLDRDLPRLMELLPQLLSDPPQFVLLTCHDPSWPPDRLADILANTMGSWSSMGRIEKGAMSLRPKIAPPPPPAAAAATAVVNEEENAKKAHPLYLGAFARWSRED